VLSGFGISSRRLVWLLGFGLLVGACSSGGSVDADRPDTEFARRMYAEEDAVAACMRDAGFEYIPWVDPLVLLNEDPESDYTLPSMPERVSYGVYTASNPEDEPELPEAVNPNGEIMNGLSPEALESYMDALWGVDGEPGCVDKAFEEVNGVTQEELLSVEYDLYVYLEEAVEQDPRVIEARRGWQACMLAKGYDVVDRWHIIDQLLYEQEMRPEGVEYGDPWWNQAREREIAIYEADVECQKEADKVIAVVEAELREAWLKENVPN